jgi:hypothetical protein
MRTHAYLSYALVVFDVSASQNVNFYKVLFRTHTNLWPAMSDDQQQMPRDRRCLRAMVVKKYNPFTSYVTPFVGNIGQPNPKRPVLRPKNNQAPPEIKEQPMDGRGVLCCGYAAALHTCFYAFSCSLTSSNQQLDFGKSVYQSTGGKNEGRNNECH